MEANHFLKRLDQLPLRELRLGGWMTSALELGLPRLHGLFAFKLQHLLPFYLSRTLRD
jgi:hypothetical protein